MFGELGKGPPLRPYLKIFCNLHSNHWNKICDINNDFDDQRDYSPNRREWIHILNVKNIMKGSCLLQQCFQRVEFGGAIGRKISENDADENAEQ